MKKVEFLYLRITEMFLLVVLISIPCQLSAQVGDVEVREKPVLVGTASRNINYYPKLEYINTDLGKYYTLTYINAEYQNITDIKVIGFLANDEDLDYVYNFLKGGYGNVEDRSLKIGDDVISTKKTVSKKSIYVFVTHKDDTNGFFYLTSTQLDRLFGKI